MDNERESSLGGEGAEDEEATEIREEEREICPDGDELAERKKEGGANQEVPSWYVQKRAFEAQRVVAKEMGRRALAEYRSRGGILVEAEEEWINRWVKEYFRRLGALED